MKIIKTMDAYGKEIEVEVSAEIAQFMKENDAYMNGLKKIDERHFNIVHFDKIAWENMEELASAYSAEDECLDEAEQNEILYQQFYEAKVQRCKNMLPLIKKRCTDKQWKRFIENKVNKKTVREIAANEGCHYVCVAESISAVERKIKKLMT